MEQAQPRDRWSSSSESDVDLALGSRFDIGPEIGRGGTAIVYLAHDRELDRTVAIKVMRPEIATRVGADRFVREMRIGASLQHPNIVGQYESGEIASVLYSVMPYVEGASLRHRLVQEKQLPILEALRITREVAGALQHAHERGVVHRDIKPENILLSPAGALLADFGLARALTEAGGDRLTSSGIAVGTPPYMSPEQAGGKSEPDARSDIYSLGCVLYEMLTGEPPFTGTSQQAIIARHMHERPPSASVVRPTIPPSLDAIIESALAKVPVDRFSSAESFARAIETVERSGKFRRRMPLRVRQRAIGATAVAVIAIAGLVTASTFLKGRSVGPDPNRLVVFPLEGRGLAAADTGIGYDLALILGAALEHTEPLTWIDARPHLDQTTTVPHSVARSIARRQSAGHYLAGVVRQDADSAAVTLRLHDVVGDSIVGHTTVAAASGTVPLYTLGLQAISRLLPKLLAPGRSVDFAPLSDRNPAAVALLLQGDREYRNARFLPALRFYERAVQLDSAFAFAALKGALAGNWLQSERVVQQMLAIALRRGDLLPPSYQVFAQGLAAYLGGAADSAIRHFERAVAVSPRWAEAWMALGDAYYHLVPSRAGLDSMAEMAFRRAVEADSGFAPPALHLAEIAVRRRELRTARAMINRFRRSNGDTTLARQLELMVGCAGAKAGQFDWTGARGNLRALLYAAKHLAAAGAEPECAESGFRALLAVGDAPAGFRWSALLGLQSILAARGRISELTALIDSTITSGTTQAVWLYVIDVEAGLPVHQSAARFEEVARANLGPQYSGASSSTLWLLGTWFARLSDADKVRSIQASIAAHAREPQARSARLLSDAITAQLAFALRDTAAALSSLSALQSTAPHDSLQWSLWEPLAVERMKLAQLLLAKGDYAAVDQVAGVFDNQQPIVFVAFLPQSLAIRYRAAKAAGKSDLASVYLARLQRLGRSDLVSQTRNPSGGS